MTHHHLNEAVPTVVLHLVAAGMNVAAALSLGAPAPGLFSAAVVAVALGGPFLAIALGASGRERVGAGILAGSYFGAAALGLYSLLGLGVLTSVLQTPQATGWRLAYFLTAALLPLLQIKGILEAGATLLPDEDEETETV